MREHNCGTCEHEPPTLDRAPCNACGMTKWEQWALPGDCENCLHGEKGIDDPPCRDCRPTGWAAKGEGDG